MMRINRQIEPGQYKIPDIFPDIKMSPALIEIFGSAEEVDNVLKDNKAIVLDRPYYMFVSNDDGAVSISLNHLKNSPTEILHLDIIHELVHVKQHKQGIELFDRTVSYVDRCTEIEAYAITVKEARRIGFTDEQILRYLQVEWITPGEQMRLAKTLNVSIDCGCAFIMDYEIYMRRLKSGEPANTFLKFLGIKPDEIKEGYARFQMPIKNEFKQINGNMDEGLIATLAGEAIAHAVMTHLKANQCMQCTGLKSEFLTTISDGCLIAEAKAFNEEQNHFSGDCVVTSEAGTAICRTKANFLISV
jgi:uncharacterized protein (TIGR00369 family)